jgi:formylglycine-generating enzyme required for sulfatase activity
LPGSPNQPSASRIEVDALSVRLRSVRDGSLLRVWPRSAVGADWLALARAVASEVGAGGSVAVATEGDGAAAAARLRPLRTAIEDSGLAVEGLFVRSAVPDGEVLVTAGLDGIVVLGPESGEGETVLGEEDSAEAQLAALHAVLRLVGERCRLDLDAAGVGPEEALRWLHGWPSELAVGRTIVRLMPEEVRSAVRSAVSPWLDPLVSAVSSRRSGPSRVLVSEATDRGLGLGTALRSALASGGEVSVEGESVPERSFLRVEDDRWGETGRAATASRGAGARRVPVAAIAVTSALVLGGWATVATLGKWEAERQLAAEKTQAETERDAAKATTQGLQSQLEQSSANLKTARNGKVEVEGKLTAAQAEQERLRAELAKVKDELAALKTAAASAVPPPPASSDIDVSSWADVIEATPDAKVVTDDKLRAAIVATGLPWRVRDNKSGIEMVLVPPGKFRMGCSRSGAYECASDENPVHDVTLTNAFYLGRYEVTQAQWTAVMASNPSYFQSSSAEVPAGQVPLRPVERVSRDMIQGFTTATGLRLPTEAEWEYAYRAGTTTAFHSFSGYPNGTNDDTLLGNIAWFTSNANSQTRPVGGKQANALGLHDMSGNVWEWVNDWYGSTYDQSSPSTNPPGPALGTVRVLRGGSWRSFSGFCRSSGRGSDSPDYVDVNDGFRAARTP